MFKKKFAPVLLSLLVLSGCASMIPSGPERTTTVASVDPVRYAGTWYELGSVKQFFSAGLVNTTANYTVTPDGQALVVVNSGRYFAANGPESTVIGSAFPVDSTFARLNVSFSGSNSTQPPGNYWIVDLDPDYQWAIVSDASGQSGFILSRTKSVTPAAYQDLLNRAEAKGVNIGAITPTPQF